MNKQLKIAFHFTLLVILFMGIGCSGTKNITLKKEQLKLVNQKILNSDSPNVIHLIAQEGGGFGVLQNVSFTTGIIEIDLLGEDVQGGSFVGIAFNIQNDSTYEAIYFRPFNFNKKEKISREHGIQYFSNPKFSWRTLRTKYEGVYEAEFINPPSPDDWFTIRIAINSKEVKVSNPNTGDLLLKVNRLTESNSEKIGLWSGHNSKGGFRNLKIIK